MNRESENERYHRIQAQRERDALKPRSRRTVFTIGVPKPESLEDEAAVARVVGAVADGKGFLKAEREERRREFREEFSKFRSALCEAWNPVTWIRAVRQYLHDLELKTRPTQSGCGSTVGD